MRKGGRKETFAPRVGAARLIATDASRERLCAMPPFNAYLFFQHVKVVYNYSDKEIQRKKGAANDEYHEVDIRIDVRFPLRLKVNTTRVNRVLHHLHPTLEGGYLE